VSVAGLADIKAPTWFAVFLPRGASEPIIRKLNRAAFATADIRRRTIDSLDARRGAFKAKAGSHVRRSSEMNTFSRKANSAKRTKRARLTKA